MPDFRRPAPPPWSSRGSRDRSQIPARKRHGLPQSAGKAGRRQPPRGRDMACRNQPERRAGASPRAEETWLAAIGRKGGQPPGLRGEKPDNRLIYARIFYGFLCGRPPVPPLPRPPPAPVRENKRRRLQGRHKQPEEYQGINKAFQPKQRESLHTGLIGAWPRQLKFLSLLRRPPPKRFWRGGGEQSRRAGAPPPESSQKSAGKQLC